MQLSHAGQPRTFATMAAIVAAGSNIAAFCRLARDTVAARREAMQLHGFQLPPESAFVISLEKHNDTAALIGRLFFIDVSSVRLRQADRPCSRGLHDSLGLPAPAILGCHIIGSALPAPVLVGYKLDCFWDRVLPFRTGTRTWRSESINTS